MRVVEITSRDAAYDIVSRLGCIQRVERKTNASVICVLIKNNKRSLINVT